MQSRIWLTQHLPFTTGPTIRCVAVFLDSDHFCLLLEKTISDNGEPALTWIQLAASSTLQLECESVVL